MQAVAVTACTLQRSQAWDKTAAGKHGMLWLLCHHAVTIPDDNCRLHLGCMHGGSCSDLVLRHDGICCVAGAGFLLWELSTPFVHLRWLLHKSGRERQRIYATNGLLMMVVFFLCRPVWGTWLSYKVGPSQAVPGAYAGLCPAVRDPCCCRVLNVLRSGSVLCQLCPAGAT
jgi:hypothetical protein